MVKASSAAASQFATTPSVNTARNDSVKPKASASCPVILPVGMGRRQVRCITASISASYHMLSAPEAPAPTAMASSEAKPTTGLTGWGAIRRPVSAVKMTSDMTRGLSSAI